jgi:hypothetical protein
LALHCRILALRIGGLFRDDLLRFLDELPRPSLAIFLPGLAQVYWIWMTWKTTGVTFSALTGLCTGCLVFGGLAVFLEGRDPQP